MRCPTLGRLPRVASAGTLFPVVRGQKSVSAQAPGAPARDATGGHEAVRRRRRLPRAERREQILAVAGTLFAERGYHAASMDELARRAGVSKPVLYDHYSSKEELFAACVRVSAADLAAQVASAVRGADGPQAQLEAGTLAFFHFVDAHRAAWSALFLDAPPRPPAQAGSGGPRRADDADPSRRTFAGEAALIRRQQALLMVQLIAESAARAHVAADPDRIEAMAHALEGAYESLALWWREHPERTAEQVARWFVELVWPGLYSALVSGAA